MPLRKAEILKLGGATSTESSSDLFGGSVDEGDLFTSKPSPTKVYSLQNCSGSEFIEYSELWGSFFLNLSVAKMSCFEENYGSLPPTCCKCTICIHKLEQLNVNHKIGVQPSIKHRAKIGIKIFKSAPILAHRKVEVLV